MKKKCKICGKMFMPKRVDSKFCSNRCSGLNAVRKTRKIKPENYRLFKKESELSKWNMNVQI